MIQTYTGRVRYHTDYQIGPHRLPVAVECVIGDLTSPVFALLDIASDWCVMSLAVADSLGFDQTPDESVPPLHSRFGMLFGRLERETIRFLADEGRDLEVQATWFVSPDWPGPTVVGWKGGMERMRFAFDPRFEASTFYFAALEEDES